MSVNRSNLKRLDRYINDPGDPIGHQAWYLLVAPAQAPVIKGIMVSVIRDAKIIAIGALAAALAAVLAGTSSAGPVPATLALRPGSLYSDADDTGLTVVDATGSGDGWHVVITGDAQVTSYQCGAGSTCTLPQPGVLGDVITARPMTGMGTIVFDWRISGTVTIDLTSGP